MKITLILALVSAAAALPTAKIGYHHDVQGVMDKSLAQKQLQIIRLLKQVQQDILPNDLSSLGKNYNLKENIAFFNNPKVIEELLELQQEGLLPKGATFSPLSQEQLKEAIAVIRVLYNAKDFDTFLKTAVWAKKNINEGQYVYALCVAVIHRPDTQGIVLPAIQEILPTYFFPTEVISKAQQLKQLWEGQKLQEGDIQGYTIPANYSGLYLNLNPEQSLSYFTEDIGLNAFYFYYNLYYPSWMNQEEFNVKNVQQGEQFLYVHQQLLARYYLERLSNGLGEIPLFDWEEPIRTGYYPSLQNLNGFELIARPSNVQLLSKDQTGGQSQTFVPSNVTWSQTLIQDYERRIRDAIDQGFVFTREGEKISLDQEEGIEILGNIIQANPKSPNSRLFGQWLVLARKLLGFAPIPLSNNQIATSALDYSATALRDPVFYQLIKRIVTYAQQLKSNLPAYKKQDLLFRDVVIEDVQIGQLVTYCDEVVTDITQAVYLTKRELVEDSFRVNAVQERLNHKPFSYKILVKSERSVDANVRVFLGPKTDEYGRQLNITNNRLNFVELDSWMQSLNAGKNVIERNSQDSWWSNDRTSIRDLQKIVSGVIQGKQEVKMFEKDYYYGLPNRVMIPKGTEAGLTYQLFVMISPYQPKKVEGVNEWYWPTGFEGKYVDARALGYPLDRPILSEVVFDVPNNFFKDVVIVHKKN